MLNRIQKLKWFLLSGVLLATTLIPLYALPAMVTQNQVNSKQAARAGQSPLPTVDYQTSYRPGPKEAALRQMRSHRYDQSVLQVRDLPPDVEPLPVNSHPWWGLTAIPADQSDSIIVGRVRAAQAHLSNDKTGVYSEFAVNVEQVLTTPEGIRPASITIERPGGAVRFSSGRVLRFEIEMQGMPEVDRRYIFFLKYNRQTDDYSVLTGYEIINGNIVPLDKVEGVFTRYQGWSEAAFLDKVAKIINGGH